jgi:hypothetical protein
VFAASLDSGEQKQVLQTGSNVEYSNGQLLFVREGILVAQAFDPNRLELDGEPIPVADSVAVGEFTDFLGTFSTSPSGLLAYQSTSVQAQSRLRWFDRRGKVVGEVGSAGYYRDPELSPDGQRIATTVVDSIRQSSDIWIVGGRDGTPTRFTFDSRLARTPRWSADGSDVFFSSVQKGPRDLFRKNAHGIGTETSVVADGMEKQLADISPDGK